MTAGGSAEEASDPGKGQNQLNWACIGLLARRVRPRLESSPGTGHICQRCSQVVWYSHNERLSIQFEGDFHRTARPDTAASRFSALKDSMKKPPSTAIVVR